MPASLATDLTSLGWSDSVERARPQAARPDLFPARVTAVHGGLVRIHGETGSRIARPGVDPPPCVGDWVFASTPRSDERARIEVVLARRTELVRQAAGEKTERQTVAANLDVVFVVTDLGDDFNVRPLERYLEAVRSGGAEPVIVLNKADLAIGAEGRYLRRLDPDWPVVVASALLGLGLDELRACLGPGRTCGFVGSSGVGKSSLVNALLGRDVQRVDHVAEDGRGRHTTNHRELLLLDGGGVLIGTPGMRELALWDAEGVDAVFADPVELARDCRFRDCHHETEPGCAILGAIEDGELNGARLVSWKKLQRQAARQALRKDADRQRKAARAFAKKVRQIKWLSHKIPD